MNAYYENVFSKFQESPKNITAQEEQQGTSQTPRQVRIQQPSLAPELSQADIYTYPQNLRDALQLIESALNRETEDKYTYDFLIKAAPADDRAILNQFQNEELNHYKLLRRIYSELTGREAPPPSPLSKAVKVRQSYCEALEIGVKELEQELLEYTRIMYAMQSRTHINMMLGILIDEIRHLGTVNFLYAKSCGK